jgi:uncharacterized membrane protein
VKAAPALLLIALLGGCGEGAPVANQGQQPKATANVSAPINDSVPARSAETPPPAPPSTPEPKSLVSRGTSSVRPAAPDYRAIGTEPFWGVTLRGSTITLERPDHAPRRFSVRDDSDGRAIRFVGDGFTLTATEGPCSDGMSDAIWSDRVQIAFADGTLKGCGGDQVNMREDPL